MELRPILFKKRDGDGLNSLASTQPLGNARYRLHFTISAVCKEKLEHAQALLSHQLPSKDPAPIIERALDLLIETTMKKRFASKDVAGTLPTTKPSAEDGQRLASKKTKQPQQHSSSAETLERSLPSAHHRKTEQKETSASHERSQPPSRHIPNSVKRQVVARDGLQCTYVDKHGRRCPQRRRLEFHHMDPYAKGGVHAVGNVTLRCKSHNQFHARRDFGKQFIATRIERARTKQESRGALVQPSCSHTDTDEPSPHQVNQTTGGQPTLPGESSQARLTRM